LKIRIGFVSNSSSESFLIYGAMVKDEDMTDEVYEQLRGGELEIEHRPDYEERYIGKSWDSIKDDQTGKEFKDDIQAKITKIFGADVKCGTHSEAWYNG